MDIQLEKTPQLRSIKSMKNSSILGTMVPMGYSLFPLTVRLLALHSDLILLCLRMHS